MPVNNRIKVIEPQDEDCDVSHNPDNISHSTISLQHKKCKVVNLIQNQINSVSSSTAFINKIKDFKRSRYRYIFRVFVCIMSVLFIMWLLLILGAVFGSALCGDCRRINPIYNFPAVIWRRGRHENKIAY